MVCNDLVYSDQAEECRLDLHLPDDVKQPPLYIYFHGGGLESGDKNSLDIRSTRERLLQHGIAVASVNYRMYPRYRYPDYLVDAAQAVAYLQRHAAEYGDFSSYAVGGSSAGGYMTMMLFFDRHYLADAGVDRDAIRGYVFDAGQPTAHFNHLRYDLKCDRRCVIIDESAPLYHIREEFSQNEPAVLITYAQNDMVNRPEQLRLLYRTMRHFGYPEEKLSIVCYEGQTHCSYLSQTDGAYQRDVTDFLLRLN